MVNGARWFVFLLMVLAASVSSVRGAGGVASPAATRFELPDGIEGKPLAFQGFEGVSFSMDGVVCRVVRPEKAVEGQPWIWRARFWGHQPQLDRALLERGFHVAYCEVGGLFGGPEALKRWDAFYALATQQGLSRKPALEGMSRGGLIIHNWAVAGPERVACIYGDNPVMDFKSWPGGKGKGPGSAPCWKQCLAAYGLSESEGMAYKGNPVDTLAPLAKAGVPIIYVIGLADSVVPVAENAELASSRYEAMGGPVKVIRKPGQDHHPHSLPDPTPLVDFILEHTE